MKKNQCVVLSENSSESGWETAEEKTASSSSNKHSTESKTQKIGLKVTIPSDKDERKISATVNHVVPEQNLQLVDALDKCNSIPDEGNLDPRSATKISHQDPCNTINLRAVNEGSKQEDNDKPCKEQECKKDEEKKSYVHPKKRGRPASRRDHVITVQPTSSRQAARDMQSVDKSHSLHQELIKHQPQDIKETMPDCFVALSDINSKGNKAKSANTLKESVICNEENLKTSMKDNPNISLEIDSLSNQQVKPNERKTELRRGESSVAEIIAEEIPEQNLGLADALSKCNSIQDEDNLAPGSVTKKSHEDLGIVNNLRALNKGSKQDDNYEPLKEQECIKDKGKKSYVHPKKRGRPASSSNHVNTIQPTQSSQGGAGHVNHDCKDQRDKIVSQEMNARKTDPVSSESRPKDHSSISKSIPSRLENLDDDVSTQTDEDNGPSVVQEVTEQICSEGIVFLSDPMIVFLVFLFFLNLSSSSFCNIDALTLGCHLE